MNATFGNKPGLNYPFDSDPDYIAGAAMFDETQALAHVNFLASNKLQGRLTSTPSSLLASNYIAARFADYGLQPGNVNVGDYFQIFTSPVTKTIEQPVLTIINSGVNHTYDAYDEFLPSVKVHVGSGELEGQVVWLGDCNLSYFGTQLQGKIILCDSLNGEDTENVVNEAQTYDVGGLLVIQQNNPPYIRSGYGYYDLIDMPAFRISPAIASFLLEGTSTFNDRGLLPIGTALNASVYMKANFKRECCSARNVLGLLPGADPSKSNEIIIVGAHYDHIGSDPDGTIYNGANDCASGVAMMLEIARLWQEQGYRPARSVLFAAWDAEEQHLQGSTHYVRNPVHPLTQTKAYLNLDMVGVGDRVFILADNDTHAMSYQLMTSAQAFGISPAPIIENLHEADDKPFYEKGIPTGWYVWKNITSAGDYVFYPQLHMPGDDPSIIDPRDFKTIGKLAAHVLFSWGGIP